MATKIQIKRRVNRIYNELGQTAVFDWVNDYNKDKVIIPFEDCVGCETSSPSLDHECLVCGQVTK